MNQLSHVVETLTRKILVVIAWIAVLAIALFLVIETGPVIGRLLVPLGLITLMTWIVWTMLDDPDRQIQQQLARRNFERAFHLALRKDKLGLITSHLSESLQTPNEGLRGSILDAFSELRALHGSAVDRTNIFIDSALKSATLESSNEARRALWNICANLEVVANQQVEFADDHSKIEAISDRLRALTSSTRQARTKLAELSLGANRGEMEEARIAMETVRRQSESLLELEGVLA